MQMIGVRQASGPRRRLDEGVHREGWAPNEGDRRWLAWVVRAVVEPDQCLVVVLAAGGVSVVIVIVVCVVVVVVVVGAVVLYLNTTRIPRGLFE